MVCGSLKAGKSTPQFELETQSRHFRIHFDVSFGVCLFNVFSSSCLDDEDVREGAGVGSALDGAPCVDDVAPGVDAWSIK